MDFQIGVGYHWISLETKFIGTTIEFTYSFSENNTVEFEDGYKFKDVKAIDNLIGKISVLF